MSAEPENPIGEVSECDVQIELQETGASICGICEASIAADQTKVLCANEECGKVTCLSCIDAMMRTMFGQPTVDYPLKCGTCTEAFDPRTLDEIIVRHEQYERCVACVFPLHWSVDCLNEHEKLIQCPFCPYLEIHTTDACPAQFLTCQHPSCGTKSCLICRHAVHDCDDESLHRSRCLELQPYKALMEAAIESGCQQRCPHCQLAGLKDDGCTHMVCERCSRAWCYFCGRKDYECKVDDDVEPSLSAHNTNWESNGDRCPMSLQSIQEVDDQWPTDDPDCLEYFHRYRTLGELARVLKDVGEEKFHLINDCFRTIDTSGYTVEEIKSYENRILINYSK